MSFKGFQNIFKNKNKGVISNMNDTEISINIHHGRNGRMNFQGVIGKMIVSAVVLSSILGTTAYADNASARELKSVEAKNYSLQFSVSISDAISAVEKGIQDIESLKKQGTITESNLLDLAENITSLERVFKSVGNKDTASIEAVLDKAYKAVDGVKNNYIVTAAVEYARTSVANSAKTSSNETDKSTLTFSDVQEGSWYYDAVMAMTAKGILSGTTTPVNGVGTYNPNGIMSRSEFLTVVTRMFYNDDINAIKDMDGAVWYAKYYMVALDKGLIKENEMDSQDLNKGCTRQEMAMIMVRALKNAKGETADRLVSTSKIADWNSIGTYYRNYVREAYSMGLLSGVDTKGTFNPKGTLTRAEAAVVAYRMMEKSTRSTPNFDVVESTIVDGHQEFVEGSRHNECKEGDVVIKADGTRVVLEKKWGILGAGQGVDIWTGVVAPNTGLEYVVGDMWTDGSPILMDDRGETHTGMEWLTISEQAHPGMAGITTGTEGEVYNIWFIYHEGFGWGYYGPHR